MRNIPNWLPLILLSAILCTSGQRVRAQSFSDEKIGIILMHGKWGSPQSLAGIARSLRRAGALVETPSMPWSRNRAYAKTYEASMEEIDSAATKLRKNGAKRIFVGGHSMGANVALGYGARRKGLSGVILLAPGHLPGLFGYAQKVAKSVQKARKLIAKGRGNARAKFKDINQGRTRKISVTAKIYLSWFDPDGPAVMTANASSQKSDVPVLCIDGTKERFQRCGRIFRYLPATTKNHYVSVSADHKGVPDAARQTVVEWLGNLR